MDKNNDGALSPNEIRESMAKQGKPFPDEKVNRFLEKVDKVTFSSFIVYLVLIMPI